MCVCNQHREAVSYLPGDGKTLVLWRSVAIQCSQNPKVELRHTIKTNPSTALGCSCSGVSVSMNGCYCWHTAVFVNQLPVCRVSLTKLSTARGALL